MFLKLCAIISNAPPQEAFLIFFFPYSTPINLIPHIVCICTVSVLYTWKECGGFGNPLDMMMPIHIKVLIKDDLVTIFALVDMSTYPLNEALIFLLGLLENWGFVFLPTLNCCALYLRPVLVSGKAFPIDFWGLNRFLLDYKFEFWLTKGYFNVVIKSILLKFNWWVQSRLLARADKNIGWL